MEKAYGQIARKKREQKIKDQLAVAYDKKANGKTTDTEYANLSAKIISLETELRSLDTLYTDQD